MPLIIPSNSISAGGYEVDNSLRFNDGSDDSLGKSITGVNTTKLTISFWTKTAPPSGDNYVVFASENNTGNYLFIALNDGLDIQIGGSANRRITTQRFRDYSAWYHIVCVFDTTQGTASDRIKIYVNGNQVTSFSTNTTGMSQDSNLPTISSTLNYEIGDYYGQSGFGYDGYLAEFCALYGQALDPTSFGEFDEDSGIWKPIDVSGLTFGTNGFYLDFENSGSLGADVSGNGNNFTVNNLTAIDQTTDTPTNNFCTMNPLYPDGTITFSEGNLKLTQGSSWRSAGGTMAVSQGKWYWEVSNVGNYAYIGFADIQLFNEGCSIRESFTTGAATTGRAHSVGNSDGRHYQVTSGGAQSSEYPAAATFPSFTNSIIGVALNLDDNNFTLYKDGTVMNPSGTPISITAGNYIPAVSIYGNNVSMNFGSPPYAISSGNTDGNGYGNFEYAVPNGYLSLCTKNLSEVLG